MLVNRLSTFRLVIQLLELILLISLANQKKSWTVYSFSGKGFKMRTINLAKIGVPVAEKIGQKDGQLSLIGLQTLACP